MVGGDRDHASRTHASGRPQVAALRYRATVDRDKALADDLSKLGQRARAVPDDARAVPGWDDIFRLEMKVTASPVACAHECLRNIHCGDGVRMTAGRRRGTCESADHKVEISATKRSSR
jgi:hypothetical protein